MEENDGDPDPIQDDDSSKWVLGIFYFNPKDKRLFPPKRIGIGWTMNWGNPYSVISLLLVIAAFIYIRKLLN